MAHKKVHPADRNVPPGNQHDSLNPPAHTGQHTPPAAADYERDPKHNEGAFARKGDHARQQQMGNKD
jgi:hypothetical protein